jgi:hypothetical protein
MLLLAALSAASIEGRTSVYYSSVAQAVSWGATCPYNPAAPRTLEFELPIAPDLLPNASYGYDWGLGCDLIASRLDYLLVPNGSLSLAQRIAGLQPVPPVGCGPNDSKRWCIRMLPVWIIVVGYMCELPPAKSFGRMPALPAMPACLPAPPTSYPLHHT